MLKRTVIKTLLAEGKAGEKAVVKGWVRTKRGSKAVNFIALNDGSTINSIQLINQEDHSLFGAAELIFNGWHSEAIPYEKEKKSLFTGLFSRFFS